jgi:dTDP-4-amino-4,6-dideoxygalactose transaminase/dTDP-4-dehydrorhamnose 3,5-epimerase-like enzyme
MSKNELQSVPTTLKISNFVDERGQLSVLETKRDLPFTVKRLYWLSAVPTPEIERGQHAHKKLWQCVICLCGHASLTVEGNGKTYKYLLEANNEGVIIPPGHWREIQNFAEGAICIVLASESYDEKDYIHKKADFHEWEKRNQKVTNVPYIDLNRYFELHKPDIIEQFDTVLQSSNFILGENTKSFEDEFARFCEADYCIGVGNGLDALCLALRAIEIGPSDEVIVAANSFVATALAPKLLGAKVVFADNNETSFNIDANHIAKLITKNTRAIIPTHLYGTPADMDEIVKIAKLHNLWVIEDAAQAHGATYKGKKCGSIGDIAAFSFYPTKNLGGIGDGGAVVTNNRILADKVKLLRNYGSTKKYHHEIIGQNSRLDELQSTFLLHKLPYLNAWIGHRKKLAKIYFQKLKHLNELTLPQLDRNKSHVWHIFPILVANNKRDALQNYLEKNNIGTNIHYPIPIPHQECFRDTKIDTTELKVCYSQAKQLLSLPLDSFHTEEEIKFVAQHVRNFFDVGY